MNSEPYLDDLQRRAMDLCLAVYRLTRFFPENEILASQIKESANKITAFILAVERVGKKMPLNLPASLVQGTFNEMILEIIRDIEKLIGYLQLAQAQAWVNPVNFDVLIKGYQTIESLISIKQIPLFIVAPSAVQQPAEEKSFFPESKREPVKSRQDQPRQNEKTTFRAVPKKELNFRQKKLLDFVRKHNEAKMADFLVIFKDSVTERTLRNDLKDLAGRGLVRAEGEFKTRKYYIK